MSAIDSGNLTQFAGKIARGNYAQDKDVIVLVIRVRETKA